MIDRKVGDKPVHFEISIGKFRDKYVASIHTADGRIPLKSGKYSIGFYSPYCC